MIDLPPYFLIFLFIQTCTQVALKIQAFQSLDVDGSGAISIENLRQVVFFWWAWEPVQDEGDGQF